MITQPRGDGRATTGDGQSEMATTTADATAKKAIVGRMDTMTVTVTATTEALSARSRRAAQEVREVGGGHEGEEEDGRVRRRAGDEEVGQRHQRDQAGAETHDEDEGPPRVAAGQQRVTAGRP